MIVYFVNPPRINPEVSSYEMPLGIVTLLASINNIYPEIQCEIVDLQLYPDTNISSINAGDGDVFCMTILSYNKTIVYNLCNEIKNNFPNSIIILGGPHATLQKKLVFEECDKVDYVDIGEGDFSLPELLHNISLGDDKCYEVPGAIRKDGIMGPPNGRIKDLSVLPSITEGMRYYDMKKIIKRNAYVSYIASRGCPYNCIYCSSSNIWGHKLTWIDSERVCSDLEWLANQGVKYVNFRDDIFTINKKWLAPVLEKLKELEIIWGCETRADCVDKNTLVKMKECGCELIRFGVESFNQKTLNILNKRTDVNKVKQSIIDAKEAGIKEIRASMMLGLPGEDDRDIRNTLDTCHDFFGVYFKFFSLYPAIGTELFDNMEKYGIELLDSTALIGHSQINTSSMSNEKINAWIDIAYKEFHDPDEDYHRDFSTIISKEYRDGFL